MKRDKISIATINDTIASSLSSTDPITTDGDEGNMDDDEKDDKNEDQFIGLCEEKGHSIEHFEPSF